MIKNLKVKIFGIGNDQNKMNLIFKKWSNILKNKENCFSIFKKNFNYENLKLKMIIKIIGKYSDILIECRDL